MKDSGIPWIGEIPEEWEVKKIKYLAARDIQDSFIDGDWIESPFIQDSGIRYLTTGNIGDGKYKEQGTGFISEKTFEELNCKYAYPGDLIFSRLNSPFGRTCILPSTFSKYVIAVDNVILRSHENNQFISFVTQCFGYQKSVEDKSSGTTMKRISRTNLGNIVLPLPPVAEQEAIAAFLDRKCGEVDEMVSLQEQVIEELKAYKQSVITEAVTKGLNPSAPMKPSNIDWIGEIPDGWTQIRLKFLCTIQTGDSDTQDAEQEGEYPFYVRSPKIERSTKYTFDGEGILMAGDGAGAGRIFHHAFGKYAVHQRVYRLANFCNINTDYLFYFISSLFCKLMDRGSAQSTVPSVRLPMLTNFVVCIPPLSEQREIADYLDRKCADIDALIALKQQKIEELREYKKSLIYEYVTGKKQVFPS